MLRRSVIFLCLFFLMIQSHCAVVRYTDVEREPDRSTGDLRFFADFAMFQAHRDSMRIDLYLKFPHTMLSFSKKGSTFVALYEGTILVKCKDGRRVAMEEFEGRIQENSYAGAQSMRQSESRFFRFVLEPGRYDFTVTLGDVNSQRRGMIHREMNVVSFPVNAVSISSIVFAERIEGDAPRDINIVPNPEKIYGEHLPELKFYYEVYIPEHCKDLESLQTRFEITSRENEHQIVLKEGETISPKRSVHSLTGTVHLRGIKEEDVVLVIHVLDREGKSVARRKGPFSIYWPLVNWGDDFELSLAQLELIASNEVIAEYKNLAPGDREPFLKKYWKNRDPNPHTEENELLIEFEKRLRHAKNRLGGMGTDRGKIYIRNGPPQEMTRRMIRDAYGYNRSAEIWVYYDPYREFVFIDNRLVRH
jgi:GWxTD domain-containing protein